MTFAHCGASVLMAAANSAGELPITSMPMSLNFLRTSARPRIFIVSWWIFSIIAGDVPAGAIKPIERIDTNPGKPASIMVGRLGDAPNRSAEVTASARTLPSRTSGIKGEMAPKYMVRRPPNRSVMTGAAPRYVLDVNVRHGLEQFAGQMLRRSDAGGGKGWLFAGMRAHVRD